MGQPKTSFGPAVLGTRDVMGPIISNMAAEALVRDQVARGCLRCVDAHSGADPPPCHFHLSQEGEAKGYKRPYPEDFTADCASQVLRNNDIESERIQNVFQHKKFAYDSKQDGSYRQATNFANVRSNAPQRNIDAVGDCQDSNIAEFPRDITVDQSQQGDLGLRQYPVPHDTDDQNSFYERSCQSSVAHRPAHSVCSCECGRNSNTYLQKMLHASDMVPSPDKYEEHGFSQRYVGRLSDYRGRENVGGIREDQRQGLLTQGCVTGQEQWDTYQEPVDHYAKRGSDNQYAYNSTHIENDADVLILTNAPRQDMRQSMQLSGTSHALSENSPSIDCHSCGCGSEQCTRNTGKPEIHSSRKNHSMTHVNYGHSSGPPAVSPTLPVLSSEHSVVNSYKTIPEEVPQVLTRDNLAHPYRKNHSTNGMVGRVPKCTCHCIRAPQRKDTNVDGGANNEKERSGPLDLTLVDEPLDLSLKATDLKITPRRVSTGSLMDKSGVELSAKWPTCSSAPAEYDKAPRLSLESAYSQDIYQQNRFPDNERLCRPSPTAHPVNSSFPLEQETYARPGVPATRAPPLVSNHAISTPQMAPPHLAGVGRGRPSPMATHPSQLPPGAEVAPVPGNLQAAYFMLPPKPFKRGRGRPRTPKSLKALEDALKVKYDLEDILCLVCNICSAYFTRVATLYSHFSKAHEVPLCMDYITVRTVTEVRGAMHENGMTNADVQLMFAQLEVFHAGDLKGPAPHAPRMVAMRPSAPSLTAHYNGVNEVFNPCYNQNMAVSLPEIVSSPPTSAAFKTTSACQRPYRQVHLTEHQRQMMLAREHLARKIRGERADLQNLQQPQAMDTSSPSCKRDCRAQSETVLDAIGNFISQHCADAGPTKTHKVCCSPPHLVEEQTTQKGKAPSDKLEEKGTIDKQLPNEDIKNDGLLSSGIVEDHENDLSLQMAEEKDFTQTPEETIQVTMDSIDDTDSHENAGDKNVEIFANKASHDKHDVPQTEETTEGIEPSQSEKVANNTNDDVIETTEDT